MIVFDQMLQFHKMLGNLTEWLDTAEAFAQAREMDPEVLLGVRLYADQFDLRRNIQSACDIPKLAVARLAEREAPHHEDGEQTTAELRARIAEVRDFIAAADPAAVDAGAERWIAPKVFRGMGMIGRDYVTEFATPNFYFHVTTCYAILRHTGVPLGKRAYLGTLNLAER